MTGSKIILVVNGPDAPSVVAQLMTRINVDKPDCTVTAVRQHLHDRSRASPLMAALRLQDRFEVVPQDVPIAALGAASLGGETAPALAG